MIKEAAGLNADCGLKTNKIEYCNWKLYDDECFHYSNTLELSSFRISYSYHAIGGGGER